LSASVEQDQQTGNRGSDEDEDVVEGDDDDAPELDEAGARAE
jgi:hypothetical protein